MRYGFNRGERDAAAVLNELQTHHRRTEKALPEIVIREWTMFFMQHTARERKIEAVTRAPRFTKHWPNQPTLIVICEIRTGIFNYNEANEEE